MNDSKGSVRSDSKSTSFSSKRTHMRAISYRKSRINDSFSFHPSLNQITKSLSSMRKRNKHNIHKKLHLEDKANRQERDRIFYENKIKKKFQESLKYAFLSLRQIRILFLLKNLRLEFLIRKEQYNIYN